MSMGAVSLHKSIGAVSLYKSMDAVSLHKSIGAASLHKSIGAASLHKSMGAASLHKSMGAASLYKSMGAASLHKVNGCCIPAQSLVLRRKQEHASNRKQEEAGVNDAVPMVTETQRSQCEAGLAHTAHLLRVYFQLSIWKSTRRLETEDTEC